MEIIPNSTSSSLVWWFCGGPEHVPGGGKGSEWEWEKWSSIQTELGCCWSMTTLLEDWGVSLFWMGLHSLQRHWLIAWGYCCILAYSWRPWSPMWHVVPFISFCICAGMGASSKHMILLWLYSGYLAIRHFSWSCLWIWARNSRLSEMQECFQGQSLRIVSLHPGWSSLAAHVFVDTINCYL